MDGTWMLKMPFSLLMSSFQWKNTRELPHALHLPPLTSTSARTPKPSAHTRPHPLTSTLPHSISGRLPADPLISTLNSATLRFTRSLTCSQRIPLFLLLCHSVAISATQINHPRKRKVQINMSGHSISVPECQGDGGYPGRRDGEVTAVRCRAAAPGVDGVLTKDATMAIKMQMGGQNRQWPGCGLHEAA